MSSVYTASRLISGPSDEDDEDSGTPHKARSQSKLVQEARKLYLQHFGQSLRTEDKLREVAHEADSALRVYTDKVMFMGNHTELGGLLEGFREEMTRVLGEAAGMKLLGNGEVQPTPKGNKKKGGVE